MSNVKCSKPAHLLIQNSVFLENLKNNKKDQNIIITWSILRYFVLISLVLFCMDNWTSVTAFDTTLSNAKKYSQA